MKNISMPKNQHLPRRRHLPGNNINLTFMLPPFIIMNQLLKLLNMLRMVILKERSLKSKKK